MSLGTGAARFHERKAAQAAGVLLRTHPSNRFEYMRLIKLLYISVRECLEERQHFMLVDRVVAMKHGPVLSRVYDLLLGTDPLADQWAKNFRTDGFDVQLIDSPGVGLLSKYEVRKLQEVAEKYRSYDVWTLSELTHGFDEWAKSWPKRGEKKAIEIDWACLAAGVGMSQEDIQEALSDAAFATAPISTNPTEFPT
jgi:uncharacterized phage-associated protein